MRSWLCWLHDQESIFAIIIAIYVTLGVEIAMRLWALLP
jgi:hypothetical protein